MQLSDEIINAFVKTLPNGEKDNSNGYELYYGTVKVSDGKTSVILDGSSVETPLNYLTMGAENGDRVTCIIKDHSLIVTGNLTHPSEGMTTKYIETMTVLAQEAAIGKLVATEGDFTELTADSAFVKRLMSDQVGASILTADEAFVGSLQTQIVTADKIKALQAEIGYVDAETLEADYLQADMANLKIVEATKASIANLLADMAFVKNATISQGHITGALDSVTLNANYITAGSLSVDRLYINGPDGKPRLVEFDASGNPVATTIDASILTDRTITADKIVANSITANEISTDFITAFKANIMETVTENLHAVTAEIEKLISGDTELDTLKLKEPLAEEYGGTGTTSFTQALLDKIYPVGSIYTSTKNVSPATFLGGTWTRIKDTFLLAAGDTYSAGATGGSSTHTLTIDEMPSHTHTFNGVSSTTTSQSTSTTGTESRGHTHQFTTGNAGNHYHYWTENFGGYYISGAGVSQGGMSAVVPTMTQGATNVGTNWAGEHNHSGTTGGIMANHTHLYAHTHTLTAKGSNDNTGGGKAHSIMPPYKVVYAWERTA